MKIRITILLMVSVLACTDEETPKEVATAFLQAFQEHDFEKAAEYSTPETIKFLQQLEKIEEVNNTDVNLPSGKIIIVSEEISGSKAIVYFKEEGSDAEEKIMLRKIKMDDERHWKVALSKSDVRIPVPPGSAVPDSVRIEVF